ncbi:major capsid protein [Flavobacterium sp.]|jgi:hypothetical protein|uniref:major capsid protein n=1 Tax=Flavobacterium sp. TaxID=239 RepID=UPI0037BEB820
MLRFTPQQQKYILAQRSAFNAQQIALNAQFGGQLNSIYAPGEVLVGNAFPVPKDAWGQWDRDGIEVARDVLAVFNDLSSLSKAVDLSVLVNHFQTVSDSGQANISLDGIGKAKTDQPVIDYHGTPLPIIDSQMSVGWRQMLMIQRAGGNYTSAGSNNHFRKVAEKLEDITLNGDSTIKVGSDQLYGLRNHPERNTDTHGFDLNGATGANWKDAVMGGLEKQHTANFRTPSTVYLNWNDWFYASATDYSTQYPNKTILQRVSEIANVTFVPASKVPVNEMLFVCKRRDVVEVLNGMPLTSRPKMRLNPEDDYVFQFMAAAALEIKFDANGNCGVTQVTKL